MADRVTMSVQAYVDEAGDDQLAYLKDESAIHINQDSGSTVVNFSDADLDDGITSFSAFKSKIVSGIYLKTFFRDFVEGMSYMVGNTDVANNLTTSASGKVLDASQGYILNANKVNKSDIANNLTTTASGKVLDARQGRALNQAISGKIDSSLIANNLTTTSPGHVLDAYQGYLLYQQISGGGGGGLTPADIVNNLNQTTSGKVLDASQGYQLNQTKVNKTDIVNNLNAGTSGKVLDAYQGYQLNQTKINKTDIVNNLSTSVSGKVLDAAQGYQLNQSINSINTTISNMSSTISGLGDDKLDISAISNNVSTVASGHALDARVGRLLFNSLAQDLAILVDDITAPASQAIAKDEYFMYYDSTFGIRLCQATKNISAGDSFIGTGSGSNYQYSANFLNYLGNAAWLNYTQVTSGI